MKLIDIPPVWLAAAIAVMWLETSATGGLAMPGWVAAAGWGLIIAGLAVSALALLAFLRARTSPIPHKEPDAIITGGLYGFSRNPIYLADVSMLFGAGLVLGAVSVVLLLPAFVALMERRFIRSEEARLAARFPDEWAAWSARVRRWL